MLNALQIPISGYKNLRAIMNDLNYDELIVFNPFSRKNTESISFETDVQGVSFFYRPFSVLNSEDVFNKNSQSNIFFSEELYSYTYEAEDMFIDKKIFNINKENKQVIINDYISLIKRDSVRYIGSNTMNYACIYLNYRDKWYLAIQPAATLDKDEVEELFNFLVNTHIGFNFNSGDELKFYQFQDTVIEKISNTTFYKEKSSMPNFKVLIQKDLSEYFSNYKYDLVNNTNFDLITKVLDSRLKYDYIFLFYLSEILKEIQDSIQLFNINPFLKLTKPNL